MRKTILAATLLLAAAAVAHADDAKYEYGSVEKPPEVDVKKPTIWKANITAGLVWIDGNVQSLGFSGTGLLSVKHWNNQLTFSGGGAYIVSGVSKYGTGGPITSNDTTARNGIIKARYDRYFLVKNTVFASFQSSGDRFAGYWYRLEPQVGYARLLFKSIHQTFRGEIGYDYTYEHRVLQPNADRNVQYHSGRLFIFYENKFTPWASFSEGLEMLEAFNHVQSFRLNSLTSLTSTIYKNIAMKLNFKLAFNNDPRGAAGPDRGRSGDDDDLRVAARRLALRQGRHRARPRSGRHLLVAVTEQLPSRRRSSRTGARRRGRRETCACRRSAAARASSKNRR